MGDLGKNLGGQWIGNLRGENGGEYVDDTTERTGNQWLAILILQDTVFTSITQPQIDNTAAIITPYIWEAGSILYGETTAFKLASGTVQALKV